MTRGNRVSRLVVFATVAGLVLASPAWAKKKKDKAEVLERYSARTFTLSTSSTPTVRVDIGITGWSTPEEREALFAVIEESGSPGLASALEEQRDLGFIKVGDNRQTIRYSRELQGEDGNRELILVTDRPMGGVETTSRLRSLDFNISVLILRLPAEGKGEGDLLPRVEITMNDETRALKIAAAGIQPARVVEVLRRD